jgi:hypothetical protein
MFIRRAAFAASPHPVSHCASRMRADPLQGRVKKRRIARDTRESSSMSHHSDAYDAHQRQRWMRHDAHLWIQPNAARWLPPGADPADVYPALAPRRDAAKAAAFATEIAQAQRVLDALREEVASIRADMARRRAALAIKYSPAQPRVPGGDPRGGQWTDRSGGQSQGAGVALPMGNVDIGDLSGSSELGDLFQITPDDTRIDGVQLAANDDPGEPTPVRDPAPKIPTDRPDTSSERTSYLRSAANWLARNAGVAGDIYTGAMNNGEWLRDYHDLVQASRDAPKSLEELQQAVNDPKPGYDIHHIVEQTAAERYGFSRGEIENPENLVRVPRLQHYQITGWYAAGDDSFDRLSPREYLKDKDWDERYRVGLIALRKFGVLK